jgi:hypothetical protein
MVKQLLDAGEAAEEALAYSCFVEGLMDQMLFMWRGTRRAWSSSCWMQVRGRRRQFVVLCCLGCTDV